MIRRFLMEQLGYWTRFDDVLMISQVFVIGFAVTTDHWVLAGMSIVAILFGIDSWRSLPRK